MIKRLLSVFILVGCVYTGFAQNENPYDLEQYEFIKYNDNKLLFPGDSSDFTRLFEKFDSLLIYGEGRVDIVHIGGSHIQADIYSNQIRERLQLLGQGVNGGRGLIFPFTTAATNNPANYKVYSGGDWDYCKNTQRYRDCELGLLGISVSTTDTNAWIHINLNAYTTNEYDFKKVKLFYEADSLSYLPVPGKKYPYVSFTNHPEEGYIEYELDTFQTSFTLELRKTDSLQSRFIFQGFYFDNEASGFIYNSVGVNGSKLESFLRCEDFSTQMAVVDPDLVILSIGTNDGYTRNFDANKFNYEYRKLIHQIKAVAPETAVLITVPNDCYLYKRYVNKNTEIQQKIIVNIAGDLGLGVWDFYHIMGGLNSSQAWYYSKIMRYDRIHFNRPGYLLKGDLLFNAILGAYDNYLKPVQPTPLNNMHLPNAGKKEDVEDQKIADIK